MRGRLLKNRTVRDSQTAILQPRAALEPPAATMETIRRKCAAAILNRPPAYPPPAPMERHPIAKVFSYLCGSFGNRKKDKEQSLSLLWPFTAAQCVRILREVLFLCVKFRSVYCQSTIQIMLLTCNAARGAVCNAVTVFCREPFTQ